MKKIILFLVLFFININVFALDINSKSAILYNSNDDKILFSKSENEKLPIASLTKIMTAIVVLENVKDLDKKFTLTGKDFKGILEENLVTAGYTVNETVTYKDLLYGLLIKSGAECANGLVNNVAFSKEFIKLMNDKVKELGLEKTRFSNYIGLDDENNYSTALEMSKIFKYALKNEMFKKIIMTDSYTSTDGKLTMKNSIRKSAYVGDYLLGGKTGTTDGAGLCLASIAKADGVNFLLVTLGAPFDRKGPHNYEDAKKIYQYYIDNYGYKDILKKDDVMLSLKTKLLVEDKIDFYPAKTIKLYLPNNFSKQDLEYKYEGKEVIMFNMKKGEKLGKLDVYYKGEKLAGVDVKLKENPKLSMSKIFNEYKYVILCLLSYIIMLLVIRKL